jgi:hypothetical protein
MTRKGSVFRDVMPCIFCSCSYICIVFSVCSVSFIVCVVLCTVCLSVVCYLCVVSYCSTLPPDKRLIFSLNNNNNNNTAEARRFGGNYCLNRRRVRQGRNQQQIQSCWFLAWLTLWPWKWRWYVSSKRYWTVAGPNGAISKFIRLVVTL